MLGHLVRQEQSQPDANRGRRRKYSEPQRSTDEALEEYEKKHNLGSYQ